MSISQEQEARFRQLMTDYVSRVQQLVEHDGTRYVLTKDAVRYAQVAHAG